MVALVENGYDRSFLEASIKLVVHSSKHVALDALGLPFMQFLEEERFLYLALREKLLT